MRLGFTAHGKVYYIVMKGKGNKGLCHLVRRPWAQRNVNHSHRVVDQYGSTIHLTGLNGCQSHARGEHQVSNLPHVEEYIELFGTNSGRTLLLIQRHGQYWRTDWSAPKPKIKAVKSTEELAVYHRWIIPAHLGSIQRLSSQKSGLRRIHAPADWNRFYERVAVLPR